MAPFQVFSFCTPLKGIRLSTRYGQMSGGDFVSFRREPDSVHDRNAIAATNRGETVGHIERSLAAALADPLDDRQIRLEGYGAFLMTCITVRIRVLLLSQDEGIVGPDMRRTSCDSFRRDPASNRRHARLQLPFVEPTCAYWALQKA